MPNTTTHTLEAGFCTICGETEEWLTSQAAAPSTQARDITVGATFTGTTVGGDTVTVKAGQVKVIRKGSLVSVLPAGSLTSGTKFGGSIHQARLYFPAASAVTITR